MNMPEALVRIAEIAVIALVVILVFGPGWPRRKVCKEAELVRAAQAETTRLAEQVRAQQAEITKLTARMDNVSAQLMVQK